MHDSFDFIHFLQPLYPGDRQRLLRGRELSCSTLAYVVCDFLCIFSHLSIGPIFCHLFFHNILPIHLNFASQPLFLLFFVSHPQEWKLYRRMSELFPDFGMIMLGAGRSSLTSPFVASHPVCGVIALALYPKECSFVIITQYLIISLPCLSQCLIGLMVTFPLH